MVLVFGVDVPFVELILILTILLVLLFLVMVYIVVSLIKINRRLKVVIFKENQELGGLRAVQEGEKEEADLLRIVRTDLDKILSAEKYTKKIEDLLLKKEEGLGKAIEGKGAKGGKVAVKKTTRRRRKKKGVQRKSLTQLKLEEIRKILVELKNKKLVKGDIIIRERRKTDIDKKVERLNQMIKSLKKHHRKIKKKSR